MLQINPCVCIEDNRIAHRRYTCII